ncbi:TonB-dependent receptor [candidate division KSB1 bacterium]|nr:TonB-dependent receptor [candidate division KSB1 bacterium]
MQRQARAVLFVLVLLGLCVSSTLWSSTTGKIAGIVIDKETGDPLPGANVVVAGTDMGAAADFKGQYTILHISPGTYSIQVSVVGYAKLTITDIRVRIDQTSRADFVMEMEALEGEAVTVFAERTVIKQDVATSVVSISAEEIQILPVSDVGGVVSMQAGVQDGFRIRGSSNEAALFLLDGVTMRDPRNNQPLTKVALSAVQEISLERGGFNAEYGQVQSGLVNVVTKEGSKTGYHGSFTSRVTPPAPKYYRGNGIPDVHDLDSYWMRPYFDDEVCWTGTDNGEWDQYMREQYPSFNGWNEVSQQLLSNGDPTDDLTPLGAQRVFMYQTRKEPTNNLADYEIDAGFGGPVPFLSSKLGGLRFFTSYRRERDVLLWSATRPDYSDYDWTLQLTSDISPSMKLRVTGVMGNVSTMQDNWNLSAYPHWPNEIAGGTGGSLLFNMFSDWAWSLTDISHQSLATKFTHTLSSKAFYEVSLEHIRRKYNSRPTALRDTSTLVEVIPGYYRDENPFGYWPSTSEGIVFGPGEQASMARDFSNVRATTLKADFTSQLNFYNMVKAGIELNYNDLDLDYGQIQMQTQGKSYANRVQMRNFPLRLGFYVQDKLESKGFTMNAGLRLDFSNSKTDWWAIDPYDPYFISNKYSDEREFDMTESEGQWQFSPRLGISHPITENSKLFFNYGHFKQMPQYESLFRVQRNASQQLRSMGDPNLTLAKTIEYELGYDHILFNDLFIQLAAFYKDITDQQTTTRYQSINSDIYTLTTSNQYEDIRGFEVTIRKTAGRWFSGFANYTYQVSSSGNFGQAELYQDPSLQKNYDEDTENLYQQRPIPSPYARTNLSLYTPDDFGPALLGHKLLGGFMLNLLLDWNQGGYTTYNPKGASGITNNAQYVNNFDATVRASKTIGYKKMNIQFMVDVYNLFNRLRLRDTGSQSYRMSLHLPESEAYDNIPGNDKIGDYREPGVEWQPMEYRALIDKEQAPVNDRPIYYEGSSDEYWKYDSEVGEWALVDQAILDQINADNAYIFNAGPSTFWFLNPRSVIFGARISFDLN